MEAKFNKCQTPLEELELDKFPAEVREPRNYTVYRHISPSGRVYVGITKLSLSFRWNHGRGYKRCKLFNRAIQKYGWNNIQHCTVCSNLDKETACAIERHLISYYKSKKLSYNITDGGEGTTGFHMPEEARMKISKYLRENRGKAVLQFSLQGVLINEFKSATEAARILGYGHTSVVNCAGGGRRENTLHGFIFIYKDEEDTLPQRLCLCQEHWKKYKIIQCKNDKILAMFDSIREAERITGISHLCISRNIRGLQRHAGNYIWRKIKVEEPYGSKMEQMSNTA